MPDLSAELRDAIVAYKTYLETGEHRQQTAYKPFTDSQFGECYSPIGKIDCIVFLGQDAVARLRPLRERLRDATEAAFADESLAAVADALATGIPFMSPGPDASVNQTNMLNPVDPVTGETRPFCEHIRGDVLAVLDRALKRLPTVEASNRYGKQSSCNATLDDFILEPTWLTVTEAARLLRRDIPGLILDNAKARVSGAATDGKFRTNGKNREKRRIDPVSFDSWRLKQRDRDLDREDKKGI